MTVTNPCSLNINKRPRSPPAFDYDEEDSTAKRTCSSPSTQQSEYYTADDEDENDSSSFQLDLSLCPDGSVRDDLSQLQLLSDGGDAAKEEVGDEMQMAAIDHATKGGNLFLTGKAGTGKSWTSKQIRLKLQNKRMWVVAPTGVAAINVDGITVHKWGGFGLGSHYSDFDKMMGERKKIRNTDVLLFDEVSMCDGHLFDVLECMVTILRYYDNEIEERGQEHIMDDSQKKKTKVKDRVKWIKSQAPIITENMGGSSSDYQKNERSIGKREPGYS